MHIDTEQAENDRKVQNNLQSIFRVAAIEKQFIALTFLFLLLFCKCLIVRLIMLEHSTQQSVPTSQLTS